MLGLLERFGLLGDVHWMYDFDYMFVQDVEVVLRVTEEGIPGLYALGVGAVHVVFALLDHAVNWRERI